MGKTQKITLYDKVQASCWLSNSEMFIKGCCVNSLPEYYGMTTLKKSDNGHTFVRVGTIGNAEKFYKRISSPVTVIPPWEHIETYSLSDKKKMHPSSLIREGRYLVVSVDLSRGKTDITNDLHSLVDICSKYIKKSKGTRKNKKHDVDIWKVFYQCNQPGFKNNKGQPKYAKVAKLFYKEENEKIKNKSPQYMESLLDGQRNNMKRAYKKACDIVKQVEKELSKEYKRV